MMKDYAYPTMMAEKALKELHNAMLGKEFDRAMEMAQDASKWIWDIREAIVEMKRGEK